MVMNKSEHQRLENYKMCATKYEQTCKEIIEQIKDLKSFLRVAIKMAEINDTQDKIIVYQELLEYMQKNIRDYI